MALYQTSMFYCVFSYRIDKYDAGFIVDLSLTICFPIGGEQVCIPDDGIVLLEQEDIPACNITAIINAASGSTYHICLNPLSTKQICSRQHSVFLFFRENKSWHFM